VLGCRVTNSKRVFGCQQFILPPWSFVRHLIDARQLKYELVNVVFPKVSPTDRASNLRIEY
jgi:hypothetical protein